MQAQDAVILRIVTENPKLSMKEPQVTEWVNRLAAQGKVEAEAMAAQEAINNACLIYETQLRHSMDALNDNLQKIQDHHTAILTNAQEEAVCELVAFRSDHKATVSQAQSKADLTHLAAHTTKHTNARPTPLNTTP